MDTARLELPATPAAASVARLFVRCLCEEWAVAEVADVAELLSSELVTNAVIHARSAIELEAARTHSCLRVDVRDVGPGSVTAAPTALPTPSEAEGGRGLAIVASLADTWGVDDTGRGKSVWFTLAIPDGDEAAAAGTRRGLVSEQVARRPVEPSVPSDA
ncbi:MAG TPA: ATP-binding protein [Frankiaceae bacterium]|nr:ATP-binding protein [Frankiaceae bacterium]